MARGTAVAMGPYAETMWWHNILWGLFGRGPNSKIEALIAAGYLLGLPFLIWGYLDLQRFRRPLWVGNGNRAQWQLGAVVAYLALGLPIFLVVFGWRTSSTRAALMDERACRRSRPTISD